jgi:hypothetical protein
MEGTPEERFQLFCQYLGSGNVDSKLWFVGIEEGGEIVEADLQRQLDVCKEQNSYFSDTSSRTSVWRIIAELVHPLYPNIPFEEFRRDLFLDAEHSHFFLTELFPLSRPNISGWPDQYKRLFGYGAKDTEQYLSDVRSTRYPIIYNKWNKVKPSLTICFGKTYWGEFENLFKVGHSFFKIHNQGNIRFYPQERIIMCKFINNYRKADEIDELRDFIAKYDELT